MSRKVQGRSVFSREENGKRRWILAYPTEPGKWKQHRLDGDYPNQRAAERAADTWLAQQRGAGTLPDSTNTIAKLSEKWLALREAHPSLKGATVRDNRSHMKNHIVQKFGALPIGRLDVPAIREWVRELRDKLAPNTVRNVVATLSAFYEDARAEGWVKGAENIVRHPGVQKEMPEIEAIAGHNVVIHMLASEAQRLLDCESVPEQRAVRYVLAFTTGMRDGELAGLKWSDVDLDAEIPAVRVERAFALSADDGGYASLAKTKTRDSVRTIPLHPAAVAALRWWRDGAWQVLVTREPDADDAVLCNPKGGHWRPKSARDFRDDLRRAGCATTHKGYPITFHSTRRSFSTWLDEAGVDAHTIDRLMGHARKSTAQRHYTAGALARQYEAVKLIPITFPRCADLCAGDCAAAQDGSRDAAAETPSEPVAEAVCQAASAANDGASEPCFAADRDMLDSTAAASRMPPPRTRECHLSSVVEQRFRKPIAPAAKGAHEAHDAPIPAENGTSAHGGDAADAFIRAAEERAAQRAHKAARPRRKLTKRAREEREVARLFEESLAVAIGDTELEPSARAAVVRANLARIAALKEWRTDAVKVAGT